MATSFGYQKIGDRYLCYPLVEWIPSQLAKTDATVCAAKFNYPSNSSIRRMSCGAEPAPAEFRGINAYELLGVSESSSFKDIKASFYKLAKETHPDLARSSADSSASRRFIQILAAYEILSDSARRAHYDQYLCSQRNIVHKHSREGPVILNCYESYQSPVRMEVVDWLKWYRDAVHDIVSEKRVVVGSDYFDVLEKDFYSALHTAYYGPEIESWDLLPDCFEAEERSGRATPEVLHLVSGRDLFGIVRVANRNPELSHVHYEKLTSFSSYSGPSPKNLDVVSDEHLPKGTSKSDCVVSDAYKDLELHVAGKLVAVATRVPAKNNTSGVQNEDSQDRIEVYLTSHEGLRGGSRRSDKASDKNFPDLLGIPLGSIHGLGTSPEEGSCCVYNNCGLNTHKLLKHRTLLVKHLHWYQVGDKVSVCECRSTRAQLPPSKFWLFEPRSVMHDIGGWYIETFGRGKKGWNVPSRRWWDGIDTTEEQFDKRLHPAMYLLALAYRTLDIEDARRRKRTVKDIIDAKVFRVIGWCKKLI